MDLFLLICLFHLKVPFQKLHFTPSSRSWFQPQFQNQPNHTTFNVPESGRQQLSLSSLKFNSTRPFLRAPGMTATATYNFLLKCIVSRVLKFLGSVIISSDNSNFFPWFPRPQGLWLLPVVNYCCVFFVFSLPLFCLVKLTYLLMNQFLY